MRLFTIPSNRECFKSATSYIEELSRVSNKYKEEFTFIIFGGGSINVDTQNYNAFKHWNQENIFKIHYFCGDYQKKWIRSIFDVSKIKNKEKIYSILEPDTKKICYGAVLNKSFLAAVSLGTKYIHRRDSDTYLIDDKKFPLEMEIKYLGKKYCDFSELNSNIDSSIYFVGGNYNGEASGDFLRLYNANPELLYRHVALNYPHKTKEEIIDLAQKRFVDTSNRFATEKDVQLVQDRMIELGNCAIFELFHYWPVAPALEIMATDYFLHDILFRYQLPNVYHNRRVKHVHTKERQSKEWFISYQLRSARYKVYSTFMNEAISKINIDQTNILNGSKNFAECLIDTLKNCNCYKAAYEKLVLLRNIYCDSKISDFEEVARIIKDNEKNIINDVVNEIEKHISLIACWDDIIEAAKSVKIMDFIIG